MNRDEKISLSLSPETIQCILSDLVRPVMTGLVDYGTHVALLAVVIVVLVKDAPDAVLYVLFEKRSPPAARLADALFPSGYLPVIVGTPAAHCGILA